MSDLTRPDPIRMALKGGSSARAARHRKEKARTGTQSTEWVQLAGKKRYGRELANKARREKRAVCRMFGISGKRYRALERKHRRERGS